MRVSLMKHLTEQRLKKIAIRARMKLVRGEKRMAH